MDETLSYDEMKARYGGEWVLVEDPEVDEHLRVLRGTVIGHSSDRDDVYRLSQRLSPKYAAYVYTGVISDGSVLIL